MRPDVDDPRYSSALIQDGYETSRYPRGGCGEDMVSCYYLGGFYADRVPACTHRDSLWCPRQ